VFATSNLACSLASPENARITHAADLLAHDPVDLVDPHRIAGTTAAS
jgi:hypothetical protein